jgi:hypothetical protein
MGRDAMGRGQQLPAKAKFSGTSPEGKNGLLATL